MKRSINGWDVSAAYPNVPYIPGVGSSFHDTAIFNTLGTAGSGHITTATATICDGFQSAPSSSRSQFAAGVGIVHRF